MFYVIVGLWLAAGLLAVCCKKTPNQALCRSCPCIALLGVSLAAALYFTEHSLAAIITIVTAIYALIIVRWAIRMQRVEAA